jgi:hypothetical protein
MGDSKLSQEPENVILQLLADEALIVMRPKTFLLGFPFARKVNSDVFDHRLTGTLDSAN